jgi:demethylmenaquinone methyltransferase / 2-methoxy-6-polyprenyl-1,4-benzoquinol methylase
MSNLPSRDHAANVKGLFTRIAERYDLMNRLITGWQDVQWRNHVIQLAGLEPGSRLLDIGTGTGDLARSALRECPDVRLAAVDFTPAMMQVGQKKGYLPFLAADAVALPFPDGIFDAVISGFLMRNVGDRDKALQEQFRVLKKDGRIVVLDTTRPVRNLFSPLVWFHMHVIIPVLGRLITGAEDAYRYLPESTEQFLTAERLAEKIEAAGFSVIRFRRYMFGTIAIHQAIKLRLI